MRFEAIQKVVDDIPFIQPERGQVLYRHIQMYKPRSILELGIGHGVSSCYMAAALDERRNADRIQSIARIGRDPGGVEMRLTPMPHVAADA